MATRMYSDDDEDKSPLKDGDVLRVRMKFRDNAFVDVNGTRFGVGHRPGYCFPSHVDDELKSKAAAAYAERKRAIADAWKSPPSLPGDKTQVRHPAKVGTRDAAEHAWQDRQRRFQNAWQNAPSSAV